MKYSNNTYIDLKPQKAEPFTHDPLAFTVRRDGKVDRNYEIRKYARFAGKSALQGAKKAARGVFYTIGDMVETIERQRAYKAEKAKQGIEVRYTFF